MIDGLTPSGARTTIYLSSGAQHTGVFVGLCMAQPGGLANLKPCITLREQGILNNYALADVTTVEELDG